MGVEKRRKLLFSKGMRIKQGRDFARIRERGQRLASGCLVLNWHPQQERPVSRLGIITSRKIGGAVVRSRARRLMREAFRLHQHDLSVPVDLVLVARLSIAGKSLSEVEKDFLTILRKANLLREWSAAKP